MPIPHPDPLIDADFDDPDEFLADLDDLQDTALRIHDEEESLVNDGRTLLDGDSFARMQMRV